MWQFRTRGHDGTEYDAWIIDIFEGDQFSLGFVELNPNPKTPALVDQSTVSPKSLFSFVFEKNQRQEKSKHD